MVFARFSLLKQVPKSLKNYKKNDLVFQAHQMRFRTLFWGLLKPSWAPFGHLGSLLAALSGPIWGPKDGLWASPLPSWTPRRLLGPIWTQSGTQNCPFWGPILGLKLKKKTWKMTIDNIWFLYAITWKEVKELSILGPILGRLLWRYHPKWLLTTYSLYMLSYEKQLKEDLLHFLWTSWNQ